ncbi:hypothetical protein ACJVC5_14610 [Peredibacter sp. HCB2-198]|uniref:hypothetical protein n=1 Tax=Peredibacter sp. HCB2-198 TaxID=3383025 RepID=UPI0038B56AC2
MKPVSSLLVLSVFFLLMTHAHAATIPSMKDCTLALYKANPWQSVYTVEDSRVTGPEAAEVVRTLRLNRASINTQVDLLNVPRYDVITKKILLDKRGVDPKACEGVLSALKVTICTEDASIAACETRCEFKWVGADCR